MHSISRIPERVFSSSGSSSSSSSSCRCPGACNLPLGPSRTLPLARSGPTLPGFSNSMTLRRHQICQPAAAKKGDNDDDFKPQQMLDGAVETVAGFVPSSVPRGIAKGGVYALGGLLVFGLIQKVLSGLLTLALLGTLGYLYLSLSGGDDDDEGGGRKRQQSGSEADDDGSPLSDARRIMDKYK